jgi:S-adenosylmethionine hydrolase
MQIVTLITDFGSKGYRTGALKGAILSSVPQAVLVDISHDITPFEIGEAAFVLSASYPHFPSGTIHVINVYNYYDQQNRLIFFERQGQFFIGPDNGIFSLIFDDLNNNVYSFAKESSRPDYKLQIGRIIHNLMQEDISLEDIGYKVEDARQKMLLQPVIAEDQIRGSVIYIDRYGNAVLNINKELFERIREGRSFALFFKRHDPICKISSHFMEADIGAPLCSFNAQGWMEIAVNLGRASSLLGLKEGDAVQIEFKNEV